jgi:Uncharacterized alpha/beta hydrolase domain (DUF2235)
MATPANPAKTCIATAVGKCIPLYRFSMFFDGTYNNMGNILLYKQKKTQCSDDSYRSDYSNVAKMFACLQATDAGNPNATGDHVKFYIQGIGTTTGKPDSELGGALGWSSTGVKDRVDETVILVVDKLNTVTKDKRAGLGSNKSLKVGLTFDVFGFSRGAAAARYFIYRMMVEGWVDKSKKDSDPVIAAVLNKQIKQSGYNLEVSYIDVNFAGLFDTVAHYGLSQKNDVNQLGLDAINKARYVVHLTAADEYRANFSLENIDSVPKDENRIEVSLPGAHSDIGGGYETFVQEKDSVLFLSEATDEKEKKKAAVKEDKKWLTDQGWYQLNEFREDWEPEVVAASRSNIPNTYSQIPLRIMVDQAKRKGKLEFKSSSNFNDNKSESELTSDEISIEQELGKDLEALYTALYKPGLPGLIGQWKDNPSVIRIGKLRHTYLHFSSNYNKYKGVLEPNAPNWEDESKKHRKRQIIPG